MNLWAFNKIVPQYPSQLGVKYLCTCRGVMEFARTGTIKLRKGLPPARHLGVQPCRTDLAPLVWCLPASFGWRIGPSCRSTWRCAWRGSVRRRPVWRWKPHRHVADESPQPGHKNYHFVVNILASSLVVLAVNATSQGAAYN